MSFVTLLQYYGLKYQPCSGWGAPGLFRGPPVSFLKITFELIGLLVGNIVTFPEFI